MVITLSGILVGISLCQTTLLPHLSIFGVTPDIYLIFIIFFSINADTRQSTPVNWAVGIAKDMFSQGAIGPSAFLFVIIGYIVGAIKASIFKEHPFSQIIVTFFATLFYSLGYVLFMSISSENMRLATIIQKILVISLYTSFVSPVLFLIFKRTRPGLGLLEIVTFEKKA